MRFALRSSRSRLVLFRDISTQLPPSVASPCPDKLSHPFPGREEAGLFLLHMSRAPASASGLRSPRVRQTCAVQASPRRRFRV